MVSKREASGVRRPADVKSQVVEIAEVANRRPAESLQEIEDAIMSARNGAGHSAEQVFSWMDAWAAGDKRPLPVSDVSKL